MYRISSMPSASYRAAYSAGSPTMRSPSSRPVLTKFGAFISSRAISRNLSINRVFEFPAPASVAMHQFPEMRRPETIHHSFKLHPVHPEVGQAVGQMPLRELLIVPAHKLYGFLAGDSAVPHLMGRIGGAAADPEFQPTKPIMEPIEFVVEARILGICPLGPFVVAFEARVLRGPEIIVLRVPG